MFKAIIYWDNATVQEICAATKPELYQKMEQEKINPEEALWELKWVPDKKRSNSGVIKSMPGIFKKVSEE